MGKGRSLELFFVDGTPDGLVSAEMFNWTGHVLQVPRIRLRDALKREETTRTGIYILLGETEDGALAYIGETDDVGKRLREHAKSKPWWDRAILITSANDLLHKAHVSYLEAKLVKIATDAGQCPLENGNAPTGATLPEAAVANMESYVENLLVILPALKVDIFTNKIRPSVDEDRRMDATPTTTPRFELRLPKTQSQAFAELTNDEFVVLKGSKARATWVGKGSADSGYNKLRDRLVTTGVIAPDGAEYVFRDNYAFASVSAAAAVILGRASNGRIEWKVSGSSRTYADWEVENINEESGPK